MYRLRITVDEVKGFCDLPVKVGDYYELDGARLIVPPQATVCIWALQALMPFLTAKQRKIAESNDWVPTTSKIACPDPNGMVIYRVDIMNPDDGEKCESNQTKAGGERVGAHKADNHEAKDRKVEDRRAKDHKVEDHRAEGREAQDDRADDNRSDDRKKEMPAGSEISSGFIAAENQGKIPRRILVDKDSCTGCRRCELACSFQHQEKYWPELSRIRVLKDESHGLDAPLVCRQCGIAKCVEACPTSALSRNPNTHAVFLDKTKCLRCFSCQRACPFGAVHKDLEDYPLICDLCGQNPKCVEVCPTGAIWFGRAGEPAPTPKFKQPGKDRPRSSIGGKGSMFPSETVAPGSDEKES